MPNGSIFHIHHLNSIKLRTDMCLFITEAIFSPCGYTVLALDVFSVVRCLRPFAFRLDVISYGN